ncbi:LacI family transcriptional regulator [Methylobacterium crusticola]|nr:LacI family transcriptional regulator [Methylobacterium crusticola]
MEQPVAEIGAPAMSLPFDRLANPGRPVRKVVPSGRPVLRGATRRS